jgi:hypothetical protein
MKKEGQVSAFLLVGLVLLVIIGLLLYLNTFIKREKPISKEVASVQSYVKECVGAAAMDGLYLIGRQGGYITLPEQVLIKDYGSMGYGYRDNQNTIPGINLIKAELESYISNELAECLNGLKNTGYTVTLGTDVHSYVTFADTNVQITSTIPMSVSTDKSSTKIDEFTTIVPVRFRRIYDVAAGTSDNLVNFPGYINMTYLGLQDVDVSVLTYNDSQVFVFEDKLSTIQGQPYRFMFGAQYHG